MDDQKLVALVDQVLQGDTRAAARLMRDIDDQMPQAVLALKRLHPHLGRAAVLGVTGSPGVGKSTLTDALVTRYRRTGETVGVVAVDPTSPFSGGAILGDRIRMQRHATDDGVFIRSLATRGAFGGLTSSTRGVVAVMDAMGKDRILVETVGVGQDEVDIARMADTTVIVLAPGMGDDIQAIKAGILEVGDIFVVNKMDREGAARTEAELKTMLAMRDETERESDWDPPVLLTNAVEGRGLTRLIEAVARHRELLLADGQRRLQQRRTARARMELVNLIQDRALQEMYHRLGGQEQLDRLAQVIAEGRRDPYSVCEELFDRGPDEPNP